MPHLAEKVELPDLQSSSQENMNADIGDKKPISLREITEFLKIILLSANFLGLARKKDTDFTRKRKLTLFCVFGAMINLIRTSTQTALDRFFNLFKGSDADSPTQQAFSQARRKIKWQSCRYLLREGVKKIYQYGTKTWRGFHVLAIDGSKIQLPSDPKLKEIFGTCGRADSAATAQASTLYDVINGYNIDATIGPLNIGERTLAMEHIKNLIEIGFNFAYLILFDRGYASFELIQFCVQKSITFVMRLKSKFNVAIDNMPLGCYNFSLARDGETISVRVIKFKLSSGEIETLITNLFDYSLGQRAFKNLYFLRWGVETQYGASKHKFEIENFSSRTEETIYQDFYITLMLQNLVAVGINEAQPIVEEVRKNKQNKYQYKVNVNHSVGAFKDEFIKILLLDDQELIGKRIDSLIKRLTRKVVPKRPGRTVPRNPCPRKSNFHFNQKSNC